MPQMVAAGLDRCRRAQRVIEAASRATYAERAVRCERLAALFEREARWWTVLDRWTYLSQREVPNVYGLAAMVAAGMAQDRARFYTGMAADWRRHAAGQPVCGVIGCGCGGVCGVAA